MFDCFSMRMIFYRFFFVEVKCVCLGLINICMCLLVVKYRSFCGKEN